MSRCVPVTDDLIVEHLARHPIGYDSCSDAAHHPYTFLKGYRDAEAGVEEREPNWSMAQGNAYDLGRFEFKEG